MDPSSPPRSRKERAVAAGWGKRRAGGETRKATAYSTYRKPYTPNKTADEPSHPPEQHPPTNSSSPQNAYISPARAPNVISNSSPSLPLNSPSSSTPPAHNLSSSPAAQLVSPQDATHSSFSSPTEQPANRDGEKRRHQIQDESESGDEETLFLHSPKKARTHKGEYQEKERGKAKGKGKEKVPEKQTFSSILKKKKNNS